MENYPNYYLPVIYGGAGIVGLISCFFGFRLFKLILTALLAISGAILVAWLAYEYSGQPVVWTVAGFVLGGVLGGVLAIFFYSVAVGTLGALFVAANLLPWIQQYAVSMQLVILGIACTLAALLATLLTNFMIQLSTAMLGAFFMVFSASYFITGQVVHHPAEEGGQWVLQLDLDPYLAITGLFLGLLGFFVQRRGAR